jgi:hypothetical protein
MNERAVLITNKPITDHRWLIDARVEGAEYGMRAIVSKDGFTVCNPSPMGRNLSQLIAAAPAMLELILRGIECGVFKDAPEYEQDVLLVMRMIQGAA